MDNLKVSIIVPVFNEEETILEVLKSVRIQTVDKIDIEIVVVDDSSSDNSLSLLKSNPNLYDNLIELPENLGKGGAIREALKIAKGEYILFQDADLEYDPSEYHKLFMPIINYNSDVVMGSRLMSPPFTRVHYFWNKIGNRLITLLFNLINNTTFTDIYSCYFLFKKNLIDPDELQENGWSQQAELLSYCVKRGRVLYEVPISYHGRTYEEGKKIRAHHIFGVFKTIILKGFFSR